MERLVALDSPASGQALTPQPFLAARHTTEPETLLSMNVPLVLRHKDQIKNRCEVQKDNYVPNLIVLHRRSADHCRRFCYKL